MIAKAEDRELFKQAMVKIGLDIPRGKTVHTIEESRAVLKEIGLPCVIRPRLYDGRQRWRLRLQPRRVRRRRPARLDLSPVHEVLIEESILGWKEYEMEVMRGRRR